MKYTLKTYKLNLNTNKYEEEETITCDDSLKAHEQLVYMYKDRDSKPSFKKYRFSYTYTGVNITCEFLQATNGEGDYRYTYKYHYEFID